MSTNIINGNFYIGKTTKSLKRRITYHFSDAFRPLSEAYNTYFSRAIRKYGKDNFEWKILYDNVAEDKLDVAEICAIYIFNPEYNLTLGGEGRNKGYKCNEETKKKMSISKKGKKFSAQARMNMSIGQKGKHHSEATKIKISNSTKGKSISEATKIKISIANIGRSYSEDLRERNSIANGGKPFDVYKKETGEYVSSWINQAKCSRDLNVAKAHINLCLHGKEKTCGGYIFKYKE